MVLTLIYLKIRLISFLGILVMTGNVNKFSRGLDFFEINVEKISNFR